ncbi:MAG TPA: glycosyltransferase family 4 protein [Pyrinomonadaceae bacterium]
MKILLVGHSCAPNRGSEPGLTWQFAWHLSQLHEVWVMTSARFREPIEKQLALTPNDKLHFVWVGPRARSDSPRKPVGELGLRLHYLFWQRAALREARRQHRLHEFGLIHHLSWGTISAPPALWRLPIPFVWGPVGGAQTTPWAYRHYLGSAWPLEVFRTLRVKLVTRMPRLRRTVRNCALLLSTNPETTRALHAVGMRRIQFHPNIGVPEDFLVPVLPKTDRDDREKIILWAGRMIPIKGLSLALEAFSKIEPSLRVRLCIAGDGPLKREMENLARDLGVAGRVDFLGAVPWLEMKRRYQDADIFLFTSLRDSSGAVLAEAMASGLPIVTLDHQGAGAIVPAEAGIKVTVGDPAQTVLALADGLRRLIGSHDLRQRMGEVARARAESMSWTEHAETMSQWYAQLMAEGDATEEYAYAAV